MPIVKTAELIGAALDYAVGMAEGLELQVMAAEYGTGPRVFAVTGGWHLDRYQPTQDWALAGPLLDKHRLFIAPQTTGRWLGNGPVGRSLVIESDLKTVICRAVVELGIGPEVGIPEALL